MHKNISATFNRNRKSSDTPRLAYNNEAFTKLIRKTSEAISMQKNRVPESHLLLREAIEEASELHTLMRKAIEETSELHALMREAIEETSELHNLIRKALKEQKDKQHNVKPKVTKK